MDVLQDRIAIQVLEVYSLHLNSTIERKTFADVLSREVQIVRSEILK